VKKIKHLLRICRRLGVSPNLLYKPWLYRKVVILTTTGSKTPEPIDTKLGVSYVGDLTLTSKYESNRSTWVVLAHA